MRRKLVVETREKVIFSNHDFHAVVSRCVIRERQHQTTEILHKRLERSTSFNDCLWPIRNTRHGSSASEKLGQIGHTTASSEKRVVCHFSYVWVMHAAASRANQWSKNICSLQANGRHHDAFQSSNHTLHGNSSIRASSISMEIIVLHKLNKRNSMNCALFHAQSNDHSPLFRWLFGILLRNTYRQR